MEPLSIGVRLFYFVLSCIFFLPHFAKADLTGSFSIEWTECKVLDGGLGPLFQGTLGKVNIKSSQGLTMVCVKKEKVIACDYLHEKTKKPKNQPSVFSADVELDGYILAGNESNSTRLHLYTVTNRALLNTTIFNEVNLQYFGDKFCVGKIKR